MNRVTDHFQAQVEGIALQHLVDFEHMAWHAHYEALIWDDENNVVQLSASHHAMTKQIVGHRAKKHWTQANAAYALMMKARKQFMELSIN